MDNWRPDNWKNPYLQQDENGDFVNSRVFEAGADAMYGALWKLAEESPTKTFTLDANFHRVSVGFKE